MIYLYGGILGGYVTLWLVSWREKGKGPFQRMAAYLLRKRGEAAEAGGTQEELAVGHVQAAAGE